MAKRSDAIKNEQLIMKTAQTLFNNNEVEKVSMKKIAETAQIGTGTLYRHFSDKSEICHALLEHHIEAMLSLIHI